MRALFPAPLSRAWAVACLSLALVFGLLTASPPRPAWAQSPAQQPPSPWQPEIIDHHAVPGRLLAVDKSAQRLFLLERRSPLAQTRKFICSTGRKEGDKSIEGDLKTPEGIYFIVQYINSGLDFVKYGKEAYTLNYPNPVDRLRMKTGYGIWIHGRGEPIVPMQTEGCVAMINEDLADMGKILEPGMPVALTSSFSIKNGPEAAASAESVLALEKRVKDWARAWASRSRDFFDFYDPSAYGIAQGEPFSRFRAQKERLFKILPWIKIEVSDIQVLEGPGYWVTWFHQDYSAPNLTSKGVRRLYWQKDENGDFKILGMEWVPGLSTGTLLASAEPALPPLEASPRTEEQAAAEQNASAQKAEAPPAADATKPADGAKANEAVLVASTEKLVAVPASKEQGDSPSPEEMPEPLLAPFLTMLNANNGRVPKGEWTGVMPVPSKKGKQAGGQSAQKTEASVAQAPAAPSPKADAPAPEQTAPGLELLGGTLDKALQAAADAPPPPPAADKPVTALEESKEAPKTAEALPPAKEPAPQTQPAEAAPEPVQEKAAQEKPADQSAPADALATAPGPKTESPETLEAPKVRVFFGEHAPENQPVQESAPSPAPPAQTPEQDIAAAVMEITGRIREWAESWQAADLEAYASFYSPDAVQGARKGSAAIRRHKEGLWRRGKPEQVKLNDIQVSVQGDTATARMMQEYSSSAGHTDIGYKTLTLKKTDGLWRITREDWKAQPDG